MTDDHAVAHDEMTFYVHVSWNSFGACSRATWAGIAAIRQESKWDNSLEGRGRVAGADVRNGQREQALRLHGLNRRGNRRRTVLRERQRLSHHRRHRGCQTMRSCQLGLIQQVVHIETVRWQGAYLARRLWQTICRQRHILRVPILIGARSVHHALPARHFLFAWKAA